MGEWSRAINGNDIRSPHSTDSVFVVKHKDVCMCL